MRVRNLMITSVCGLLLLMLGAWLPQPQSDVNRLIEQLGSDDTQVQLDAACGDVATRLPQGLTIKGCR